jgi:hypothetical protein
MSYLNTPNTYNLSAGNSDVPPSLSSSPYPRPMASTKNIVAIASTSADQNQGGLITFSIPTGMGSGAYLVNNSMYLQCKIQLTTTNTPVANTKFALPTESASAIINRITVSIGSTQVNQINSYHLLHDILLSHTTSRNFVIDDSAVLQFTGVANALGNGGASAATNCDVCIPLIIPLFNERSFPLFLCNSPILIQIDLNQPANCLRGAALDCTGYVVKNPQLVYETLTMSPEYIQEVKMAMSKGLLYQLNVVDYMTLTCASTAYLNYLIGANLSSVRGVFYTQVTNAPAVTADTWFLANSQTNFRLYLDGRQINNFNLSTTSQIYTEFQRCLGNMFDSNITSFLGPDSGAGATNRANFLSRYFAGGVSCNRISDSGFCMTGTPAQNINLVLESAGGNYNVFIVVLYDEIVTIDATGNVQLIK